MARWGLIEGPTSAEDLARRVYRPDLYAEALALIGVSIPLSDRKVEGGHSETWNSPATPAPIALEPDVFRDGAVFDAGGGGGAG